MTQLVKFPDKPWAQLATIAEKRGMTIADVIVSAANFVLEMPREPDRVPAPRPRARPHQAVDWDEVARLHADGLSDPDIAREMGRSKKSVANARTRMGLPANLSQGRPPVLDWRDEVIANRIRALVVDMHYCTAEVARELGVSEKSAKTAMTHLGMSTNNRHTNPKENNA